MTLCSRWSYKNRLFDTEISNRQFLDCCESPKWAFNENHFQWTDSGVKCCSVVFLFACVFSSWSVIITLGHCKVFFTIFSWTTVQAHVSHDYLSLTHLSCRHWFRRRGKNSNHFLLNKISVQTWERYVYSDYLLWFK